LPSRLELGIRMDSLAANTRFKSLSKAVGIGQQDSLLLFSAFMFRIGLALVTFEQIRPFFGIQVSDYCLFLSLLVFLSHPILRLEKFRGSGVLLAGSLILMGSVLSLLHASNLSDTVGPLSRLFVLFGLFGPLALIHSRNILENLHFLMVGIFVNCVITLLQASAFPGIADTLSINPTRPDISDIGRFQGLTSHPNIIGLSAALAVMIGFGLLSFPENRHIRGRLVIVIFVCTLAGLLSGSRAVFVSLIPSLMVFLFLQKQRRRAVVRGLVVLGVLWGTLAYVAPAVISQFSERLDSTGSDFYSDYGRLWSTIYTAQENFQKPIIGWGVDHLDDAGLTEVPGTGEIVGAHNTFLKYWHGAGLLGAVGFLTIFAVPAKRMLWLLKKRLSRSSSDALQLSLSCFVLLFIVSNLGPFDYNRFLYVPLFAFAGFAASVWLPTEVRANVRQRQVGEKSRGTINALTT
jgi:O-antigen ligase